MFFDDEADCYRRIFEQHHTVMLIIDPATGSILHANPAAADYYGWSVEELQQKNISEINTLSAEQVRAEMTRALSQQRNFFEFGHRLADGRIRDIESRSTPVVWEGKQALCSMVTDVTERKQAERELHQANLQLEQLVAERTEQVTAANEELVALNEELTAQNEEIASINMTLEQRVEERTSELAAAHQELLAQYEELQAAQQQLTHQASVQAALREIVEATICADSLDAFYQAVHLQVRRVLNADNVYITLMDATKQHIVRPYLVDGVSNVPQRRRVGKGWTEYVMRTGKPLHMTQAVLDRMMRSGEVDMTIDHFHEWIGAPLLDARGDSFGVVALFSTTASQGFGPADLELLSIIAAQISLAIQRKQAETAIVQSESLQKSIVRAAPVGIGMVRSRMICAANDRLCEMTGYAEDDLLGLSSRILYDTQEAYDFVGTEKYRQITERGTGTVETQWRRKDGRIIDVLLSSTPLDLNNLDFGVTFTALDITDLKQAEADLRESEDRYRAIIQQAPEAVVVCDPENGEVLEANLRFTEKFGYDLSAGDSLNIFDFAVDQRANVEAILQGAMERGYLPIQRRVMRHRNGAKVPVERSAAIVRYRGRSLLVQFFRDISEVVRREEELRHDIELAGRVQSELLKMATPSKHLTVTTLYQPQGYVGGDLYFMDWRYEGTLLRGYLLDATGHGLSTALHTASMHVLLREVNELDLPLPEQMRWLNRRAGQYFDESTFAGALGFELDLQTRQLRWCCAGMPLVWLATTERRGLESCPGLYLGICSTETFEVHTVELAAGDAACFMTDGFSRLVAARPLEQTANFEQMQSLLQELSQQAERSDDATAICLRVNSLPERSVKGSGWPRVFRLNGYGDYQRFKPEVSKVLAEVTGIPHSLQEVAVNEALANAMECRDGVARQHRARLRINKLGNRLVVRVHTSRIGFAGNALLRRLRSHPEEMFSYGEDAWMGRGIPIMLSTTDRMTYNNEGTEVLLVWKLC